MEVSSAGNGDEPSAHVLIAAPNTLNTGASPVRGVKRHADETNLNDEQRFAKRFNLLSLDADGHLEGKSNYYIPITPSHLKPTATNGAVTTTSQKAQPGSEHMQLDDTADRVYVHNLDEELADIEAQEAEPKLIFLPDIEKRFNRIPEHVLNPTREKAADKTQELVLYSVPKSLTVDEGQDSVRKAIIEARQRVFDNATVEARHRDMTRKYESSPEHDIAVETAHGYGGGYEADTEPEQHIDDDVDAMDIA